MLHRLLPLTPHLWSSTPPPRMLLVLQRAGMAVALALPLVCLHSVTGGVALRSVATLDQCLAVSTTVLVVLLAARVAASVHRWRLGHSDVRELNHATRSIISLACSFLRPPLHSALDCEHVHTQHAQFVADLKRFLLAYIALSLQDCRDGCDAILPNEQLRYVLDDAREIEELRRCERNKPRAAVVELWLRTCISRAGFSSSGDTPLLPHTTQTMELHRIVSTLPVLYENAVRAWSHPPQWRFLTVHTPPVVYGYLVFFTVVRTATTSAFLILLWVFSWGLVLFAVDALASALESRHAGWGDSDDALEQLLLDLQEEVDAIAHAFFRSSGGLVYWERSMHSVQLLPRQRQRPQSIPRTTSSIAPASPRSRATGSPRSHDGGDGLIKPSLKHVLDMITTSSPSLSLLTPDGTAAERRPLLQGSHTPAPRYDLFLRRDDESSFGVDDSDATDVDEVDVEDHVEDRGDPPV